MITVLSYLHQKPGSPRGLLFFLPTNTLNLIKFELDHRTLPVTGDVRLEVWVVKLNVNNDIVDTI